MNVIRSITYLDYGLNKPANNQGRSFDDRKAHLHGLVDIRLLPKLGAEY